MYAAVVTAFDRPPRYQDFPDPVPSECQSVVDVLASGLHPRVRSQANGSHYTASDELPLVPGIDGVGRRADGALVYFILPDTRFGAMAERVAIDVSRSIELPAGTDPVLLAAAMNPAMSSWVALRRRVDFTPGHSVLILGAAGADVDVLIDYLWGEPARRALHAIVPARTDDDQQLTWIQIGSVAGQECAVPSAALRATRLQVVGSGQGSVSPRDILAELPELAGEIGAPQLQGDRGPGGRSPSVEHGGHQGGHRLPFPRGEFGGQRQHWRRDSGPEFTCEAPSGGGDAHLYSAPVARARLASDQTALLGALDQAGDAGAVQAQVGR